MDSKFEYELYAVLPLEDKGKKEIEQTLKNTTNEQEHYNTSQFLVRHT